ncbi:MAG: hypothetical protein ABIH42_02080 [Planctomycetota bacterium]
MRQNICSTYVMRHFRFFTLKFRGIFNINNKSTLVSLWGFTLLELLIATSIFLILGVTLMAMLHQGISIWRSGESRKQAHEKMREVLEQISNDFSCAYTLKPGEDQPLNIMFLCDFIKLTYSEDTGRAPFSQRLRFIRTLKGAGSDFAANEAGSLTDANSDLDLVNDNLEAHAGLLRSTGGLCEVAYIIDSVSEKVYRGIKAPIGGVNSFLVDLSTELANIDSRFVEIAEGVMFLGFSFWTPYTNTWDESYLTFVSKNKKSGPLLWWDSTRGLLPPSPFGALERDKYTLYCGSSSYADPNDDVFPRNVRVTLVISEKSTEGASTFLSSKVSSDTLRIPLENASKVPKPGSAFPYVKIDNEWIKYSRIEENSLVLDENGRGKRGTFPAQHARGALVRAGLTFIKVISLPCYKEDWNDK